ncbi:dTDP-4-dehydrorhamnose reductase [Hyphomonas sp.]|uniref:dTDP-4-dehydrorhamnose reductase n=1 Tax=Hyphomonas sp. TaxID=87 RepID=UPI003527072B
MTRILVIGKSGQLAQALVGVGGEAVLCPGRSVIDLLDAASHASALESLAPDIVINTGAFTSVDGAESAPDAASALNVEGPRSLAEACDERGIPLIHISTDCVFDGTKPSAYTPEDVPHPLGIYGQTKLDGERAVREVAEKSLIVRVSWLFSRFGGNFVRTMLALAQTRDAVTVVSDQFGCPTHTPDLARALLDMAGQAAAPGFDAWGVYHLAGSGETNRATMARAIYNESGRLGGPVADVVPILTVDYPTPAQRPLNARLDMTSTRDTFRIDLPPWTEGLKATVETMVKEMSA